MAEELIVEPRNAAVPVEPIAPVAEETEAAPTGELNDEVLQIPAMQALIAGSPPALSANLATIGKLPEAQIIAANKDGLMSAGIGLYRSLDGANGVFFNQLFVSPDEIKAADQAGTLMELAPPFESVNAEVAKSGANNPVLNAAERPAGFATNGRMPTAATQGVPVQPPQTQQPASVQKSLANDRVKNMQIGPPTSGPAPGQGKLLRAILRPVI